MSDENAELTQKPLRSPPVVYDWLRLLLAVVTVALLCIDIKNQWYQRYYDERMLYFLPAFLIPFFFGLWGWMAFNHSLSRVSKAWQEALFLDKAPFSFAGGAVISAVLGVFCLVTGHILILFFPLIAVLVMFLSTIQATGAALFIRGRFWIFVTTAWCLLVAEMQVVWILGEIFDH